MIMTDDRRSKDSASPPDPLKDPWADWAPAWGGQTPSPHDLQERHSPTEPAAIRLTPARSTHRGQRRIVDNRLWDAMTAAQQDAAIRIALSFEMMGRGLGYVQSNWRRIPGCRSASNVPEIHTQMINTYVAWAQKCTRQKISHSMVIDILCFGFSCRMLDRDRRLRTGMARENLMKGVSLYCHMMGWSA